MRKYFFLESDHSGWMDGMDGLPPSEHQAGKMVASHVRNGSKLHDEKIDVESERAPVVFDNSI